LITAFGSVDSAIAAIRAGAYDFLTKPFEFEALELAIARAAQHRSLREEVRRLREQVSGTAPFSELVGESAPMRELYDLVARVAGSDASVLVTGESGTGKELVARALHRAGRGGDGPFVAINCAALPEALLESELFGHVRGAFTDARTDRVGLLVQASGGTLLFDEIGELPATLQPKLLRALQERRVRPVGGTREEPFDARIIAATNRDLEAMVEDGSFREDLFFRINVIHIAVPPLRGRGNDVLLLAQRFLQQEAKRAGKPLVGIGTEVAERLLKYDWPGNVRELHNCIERAVALARYDRITVDDLPERIRCYREPVASAGDHGPLLPLAEVERRHILRVLEECGGNQTTAARILGLARRTLHRKLLEYRGGVSSGVATH
jgi:two-component system response regulator HydG